MKRSIRAGLLCSLLLLPACYTMTHTVGKGGSGKAPAEARQWFVLWGLVPINQVDGGKMAPGASDYTIRTQLSFLDVVINIFTTCVTVVSRTVVVTK